jgi:hypothetical protein
MILPWAHRLISAGAHGLRRIPGQSVNLAQLIWRAPRAPAPLPSGNKVHPRWFSARGYGCCKLACNAPLKLQHRKAFSNLPIQGVADIAVGVHAAIAAAFHGRGVHGRPIFDFDR